MQPDRRGRAREKQTSKTGTGFAPLDLCKKHAQPNCEKTFRTAIIGLRYHAGAGTQFAGLCAIPPVRIPYDAKKIRTRYLSSYYFLWRSIRDREIAKRASVLAKRASALTVRGRVKSRHRGQGRGSLRLTYAKNTHNISVCNLLAQREKVCAITPGRAHNSQNCVRFRPFESLMTQKKYELDI